MAWLDDRAWCHPKFTDLSSDAFRVYWNGVSYSSGMSTGGVLSPGQQRILGATADTTAELVAAVLWNVLPTGAVEIHNWAEHNGKRDARRKADRERKRAARNNENPSDEAKPPDVPVDCPADVPADNPQDGSALTVVKEVTGDVVTTPSGVVTSPKRNPMWDALTDELGDVTNEAERKRRNQALKLLRQSGATPGDIHVRAGRYREAWPDITLTAMGLASNWATFAKQQNGHQTPTRIATMFDEEEHDASAGRTLGRGD